MLVVSLRGLFFLCILYTTQHRTIVDRFSIQSLINSRKLWVWEKVRRKYDTRSYDFGTTGYAENHRYRHRLLAVKVHILGAVLSPLDARSPSGRLVHTYVHTRLH